jgi:transposase
MAHSQSFAAGPGERGPAIADKRRTMNGILWVLRTGAPWRDLPSHRAGYTSHAVLRMGATRLYDNWAA